jgi:hypothetical protein
MQVEFERFLAGAGITQRSGRECPYNFPYSCLDRQAPHARNQPLASLGTTALAEETTPLPPAEVSSIPAPPENRDASEVAPGRLQFSSVPFFRPDPRISPPISPLPIATRKMPPWRRLYGGRGGIRTPDTLSGTPVFKTGAINHSATLPCPHHKSAIIPSAHSVAAIAVAHSLFPTDPTSSIRYR